MTASTLPPPVRGDQRSSWKALAVIVVLIAAAIAVALLVAPR